MSPRLTIEVRPPDLNFTFVLGEVSSRLQASHVSSGTPGSGQAVEDPLFGGSILCFSYPSLSLSGGESKGEDVHSAAKKVVSSEPPSDACEPDKLMTNIPQVGQPDDQAKDAAECDEEVEERSSQLVPQVDQGG